MLKMKDIFMSQQTTFKNQAPDLTAFRRSPTEVMRLARMGSFHRSRLSFIPTLLRRMTREGWTFERSTWEIDATGVGYAVYRATGPERTYSLVAFAHNLPDDMRSDRVIATAWDATFTLFDGIPTVQDIVRLRANVPKQEAGRISESELTLARANRSVRLWTHVVDSLAEGRQPEREQIEAVGYLMRTTAVYGSGKFGAADRAHIADRPEFKGPFRAEMLTVWLIRAFTLDLVEHMARVKGGHTAVTVAPDLRRRFGVGNSTGLGMAPFIINHPALLHRWMAAREEALARVRAVKHATVQAVEVFEAMLADARRNAAEWHTEHPLQIGKVESLRSDLALLTQHVQTGALSGANPWERLYHWASTHLNLEGQEQLVSLLMEPYPDLVDDLAEDMDADEQAPYTLVGSMPLQRLRELIKEHFAWAMAIDFSTEQGRARFWYVSEEKLEPRLGERAQEEGASLELPLCVADQVQALARDLQSWGDDASVADFLLSFPVHRQVLRRIQLAQAHPYAEIQDNLIDAAMLPIDLLRCKLSFFGATKFDPRSNRWVRISLFQDTPFPHELSAAPKHLEGTAAVRYSLAEIEALSRKATRGSGLDWGLADEAGKAARWLASVGLPGPKMLNRLLERNDGKSFTALCPIETTGVWQASSGELSPLIAGASLVDRAEQLSTPQGIRLGKVSLPMLILPFVARAASLTDRAIEVNWPGVRIVCHRASIAIEAEKGALAADLVDSVLVRPAQFFAGILTVVSNASAFVDLDTWTSLTRMAHRTLVPASEASRAGAGGRDSS